MAATQERTPKTNNNNSTTPAESAPHSAKIDPAAPAGSKNSLGEQSVRDGRPATDDDTVEAIDEATPVTPAQPSR